MIVIRASRRVHAPLELVGDYLAAVERLPRYDERIDRLEWLAPGRARVRGRWPASGEYRIAVLPGRGHRRTLLRGWGLALSEILAEEHDGFTRLVWTEEQAFPAPLGGRLERLAEPVLRGVVDRALEVIKLEVELALVTRLRTGEAVKPRS